MSWGRGVQNNTAGTLRMPSVAQFAEQRLAKAEASKTAGWSKLVVLPLATAADETAQSPSPYAYVSDDASGQAAEVCWWHHCRVAWGVFTLLAAVVCLPAQSGAVPRVSSIIVNASILLHLLFRLSRL